MRAVKSANTGPEMLVRRVLYSLGYRYRLHRKDLPGKPDIVLPGRRAAIFVHGCFWHGHLCKRGDRKPKANAAYWLKKITSNKARDARNMKTIRAGGWRALTVWECEIKDAKKLERRLKTFLDRPQAKKTARR